MIGKIFFIVLMLLGLVFVLILITSILYEVFIEDKDILLHKSIFDKYN